MGLGAISATRHVREIVSNAIVKQEFVPVVLTMRGMVLFANKSVMRNALIMYVICQRGLVFTTVKLVIMVTRVKGHASNTASTIHVIEKLDSV